MPRVIKAFRERYQGMKLYNVGDEYPGDDAGRVQYLVSQGFLEEVEEQGKTEPPTLEQFAALSAAEQKGVFFEFNIEGDDSNAEKRETLYKQFLVGDENTETEVETPDAVDTIDNRDVNTDDPDA